MRKLTDLEKVLFHSTYVERCLSAYAFQHKDTYVSENQHYARSAKMLRDVIRDADLNDIYTIWNEDQLNRNKKCSIGELVEKLRNRADNKIIFVIGSSVDHMCLWSAEGSVELPANSITIGIRMNTCNTSEKDRESIRLAMKLLSYDSSDVKVLSLSTEKPILFRKGIHRTLPTGSVLLNVNINEG